MQCRICFDDAVTERNRLIDPCACSGSSQYIHELCLKYWIRMDPEKNSQICPVCKSPYRISLTNKEHIPNESTLSLFILDRSVIVGCFTQYGVLVVYGRQHYVPIVEAKTAQLFFQVAFHLSYAFNNNVRNKEAYRYLVKRSYMPAMVLSYLYFSYEVAVNSNVIHCFVLSLIMNLIWREHVRILGLMNAEVQ
jgi:E3 ubiquitin-protein ligase DOA10